MSRQDEAATFHSTDPEAVARHLCDELTVAEKRVADLRNRLNEQARIIAKARGIGFIRVENLRREFG